MDITEALDQIIYKYNLNKYYPHYRKMQEAKKLLGKIYEEDKKNQQKVIWVGDDQDAIRVLKNIEGKEQLEICVSVEVQQLEQVQWTAYDKIYVFSFYKVEHMLQWFRLHQIEYIWIYDVFEEQGILLERPFAIFGRDSKEDWFPEKFLGKNKGDNLYLELFFQQRKLEVSKNERTKQIALEKCLFLSLYMKNFVKAEEYFKKLGEKEQRFVLAKEDIYCLLEEVKKKVKESKKKHIIIYWLDAINYEEAQNMPYLQETMKNSVCFENAFTHADNTNPTLKAMFCQAKFMDDRSYQIKKITEKNSKVLCFLSKSQYAFKVISGYFSCFEKENCSNDKPSLWAPASMIFWELIKEVLVAEKNTVFLAHAIVEGHAPSLSSSMEDDSFCSNEKRRYFGKKELDNQLCFYDAFFDGKEYKIYMNDHGSGEVFDKYHVLFNVYGKNLEQKTVKGIFSLLDFHKVLKQLVEKEALFTEELVREYAEIQRMDYYSPDYAQALAEKKVGFGNYLVGGKGVITKDYLYLKYRTGKQWLLDKNVNLSISGGNIFTEYICNDAVLPEFQKIIGEFPKDLLEDEQFWASKYLYKFIEKKEAYLQRKMEIICATLEGLPEKSVALRMGGEHSYYLYLLLPKNIQKKIAGVIDVNLECYCSRINLPVFAMESVSALGIQGILLSSYNHLEMLREEAKGYSHGIKVIDIYEELEKQGIFCDTEFYNTDDLTDEERRECMPFPRREI